MLDDKKLVKLIKEAVRKKADTVTELNVQRYEWGYLVTNTHWMFLVNFTHKKTMKELEKIFGSNLEQGRIDSRGEEMTPRNLTEKWESIMSRDMEGKEVYRTYFTIDALSGVKGRVFVNEEGDITTHATPTVPWVLVFNDEWVGVFDSDVYYQQDTALVLGKEGIVMGIKVEDANMKEELQKLFHR